MNNSSWATDSPARESDNEAPGRLIRFGVLSSVCICSYLPANVLPLNCNLKNIHIFSLSLSHIAQEDPKLNI